MNQHQIDALSVDQLRLAVCLATRECPGFQPPEDKGDLSMHLPCEQGYIECGFEEFHYTGGYCPHCGPNKGKGIVHELCSGTGRVWALQGMQERCPWKANIFSDAMHDNPNRKYDSVVIRGAQSFDPCHGTGWVAKRDLGALLAALFTWGWHVVNWYEGGVIIRRNLRTPLKLFGKGDSEQALLRAVAQALVAQGAALGVTA